MSSLMQNNSSITQNNFRHELSQYVNNINNILFYFQISICLMGLLGNLLALIVINRKSLRNTSSAVFITYMALFDSAVLLVNLANLTKLRRYHFFHCSLTYLIDLSTFCANWVLVIITLERCVAVYSPFLAKRFCTVNSARHSMYILFATALIFCSGSFPLFYQIHHPTKPQKCIIRAETGLILRIYQLILFYVIPDIFLLSNLFTVYALCQRRQRLSTTYLKTGDQLQIHIKDVHSSRRQRQLTIMLVTVSLSFYLFTTPAMVMYIIESHPITHRDLTKIKQMFLFAQISVILSQLNNATNFIFYCFAGQRFRQATVQTFYYYSRKIKIFYHRYILCNTQYDLTPVCQRRMSSMGNSIITKAAGSCSPYHYQQRHRTSTI